MLELKSISAGYDDHIVLKDISFKVNDCENLSIIGPNGCGKTTLLRVIANTIEYTGDIFIDGVEAKKINRKELAKKIALFSQISNIYFDYSIFDTVLLGRYSVKKKSILSGFDKDDKIAVEEILKKVGLWEVRHQSITTLSGGQLQRVFLAKTLVQDPEIILLDEPTNHLDLYFQVELIDFIKDWAKNNKKTVIGVLHDFNLAMRLSDKILLINDGKIESIGEPKDVLKTEIMKSVYKMDVGGYMREALKKWENL